MLTDELSVVCRVPGRFHGTGKDLYYVRQSDGWVTELDRVSANLLSRASFPHTVSQLINDTDSMENAQRVSSIHSLVQKGLLAPVEKPRHALIGSKLEHKSKCRVTSLCIPTCRRPLCLSRCVRSFLRCLREHGRDDATITIVDDSNDPKFETQNREAISSLDGSEVNSIRFYGYSERMKFLRSLLCTGVAPEDVLKFSISPDQNLTTVGSARNMLMLLTSGEYSLQTDDDTSCAYAHKESTNSTVIVSSAGDPCDTYFYSDRQSNLNEHPLDQNVDPFGVHEAVLGRSIPEILCEMRSIVWDKVNPHLFAMDKSMHFRANITSTGTSGDSGMGSSFGVLVLSSPNTLQRIYSDHRIFDFARHSKEVMRMVPELTLSVRSGFQSMSFGLNTTELLPPFFPVGRNQDGAFAALYSLADESSLIAHLPYAISHEPDLRRSYQEQGSCVKNGMLLSEILILCLQSLCRIRGASTNENLRCMGEQLAALGSISPAAFRSYLKNLYVKSCLDMISRLETGLSEMCLESRDWIDTIGGVIRRVRSSIGAEESIVPLDLAGAMGNDSAQEMVQKYFVLYGRLIRHWEDILSGAKAARDRYMLS